MGVSGCGKTTVGKGLAEKLNLPFYDADAFHSAANIEKMAHGTPLTDDDRHDWLATLATKLNEWEKAGGAVLACSALKEKYRTRSKARRRSPCTGFSSTAPRKYCWHGWAPARATTCTQICSIRSWPRWNGRRMRYGFPLSTRRMSWWGRWWRP